MSDHAPDRLSASAATSSEDRKPSGLGVPFRPPQREAFRPTPPGRTSATAGGGRPDRGRATSGEHKKLLVGREIELSGVISACDTLVVEGRVETDLSDAQTIEVTQTGTFKGCASVDHAEISGHFDGDLTVHKTLTVSRSGRVTGTIRYATLEVEAGGRLSGTIQSLDDAETGQSLDDAEAGKAGLCSKGNAQNVSDAAAKG